MSMAKNIEVACPNCQGHFSAKIFSSVNTDFAKDLAAQIISGNFFEATCPHCGFKAHLEYQFLYHDMNHWALVWVVNPNTNDIEAFASKMRADDMFNYEFSRIVYNTRELREKVSCLESGRSDKVVELCKAYLSEMLRSKGIHINCIFYECLGEVEVFYLYVGEDECLRSDFPEDLYSDISDRYLEYEKSHPINPYSVIDSHWANPVIRSLYPNLTE